jgi:hypothetical protein
VKRGLGSRELAVVELSSWKPELALALGAWSGTVTNTSS